MERIKKLMLIMTCAFVLLGTTACGSRNNADNGADQTNTDNGANDSTDNTDDGNVNDATEGNGILEIKNLATKEQIAAKIETLDETLDSLFGESEEGHHHE